MQKSFEDYKACSNEAEKKAFLIRQRQRIAVLSVEEAKAEIKAIAEEAKEMVRKVNPDRIRQKSA